MSKKLVLFLILTLLAVSRVSGQDQPVRQPDCSPKLKSSGNNPECFKPVVYGKSDDGYPTVIKIKGVITEVTFVPVACGVLCHWGTAKIRLLNKPAGYNHEFVYVTVLCFGGEEKDFVNKVVNQKATRLIEGRHESCTSIFNIIDSQGVIFYDLMDEKNQIRGKLNIVGETVNGVVRDLRP